jgi:hypothetical protein
MTNAALVVDETRTLSLQAALLVKIDGLGGFAT